MTLTHEIDFHIECISTNINVNKRVYALSTVAYQTFDTFTKTVFLAYGMTEIGVTHVHSRDDSYRRNSVGKRVPLVDLKVMIENYKHILLFVLIYNSPASTGESICDGYVKKPWTIGSFLPILIKIQNLETVSESFWPWVVSVGLFRSE